MCPLVLSDANKNTRPLSEWQTTITRPLRYRWSIRSACSLSFSQSASDSLVSSLSLSLINYFLSLCPRPVRISWTHSRTIICLQAGCFDSQLVDSVVFMFSDELLLVVISLCFVSWFLTVIFSALRVWSLSLARITFRPLIWNIRIGKQLLFEDHFIILSTQYSSFFKPFKTLRNTHQGFVVPNKS